MSVWLPTSLARHCNISRTDTAVVSFYRCTENACGKLNVFRCLEFDAAPSDSAATVAQFINLARVQLHVVWRSSMTWEASRSTLLTRAAKKKVHISDDARPNGVDEGNHKGHMMLTFYDLRLGVPVICDWELVISMRCWSLKPTAATTGAMGGRSRVCGHSFLGQTEATLSSNRHHALEK